MKLCVNSEGAQIENVESNKDFLKKPWVSNIDRENRGTETFEKSVRSKSVNNESVSNEDSLYFEFHFQNEIQISEKNS